MSEATVALQTPEGVPLEIELASVVDRFSALVVDLVILAVASVLLVLAVRWVGGVGALPEPLALAFLGLFLARYGYFVFFEIHWRGTTPGKRLLRLRVIARDGAGLGVDSVIARNLMRDLELFLPLAVVVGPEQLVGPSPPWLWAPALAWVLILALLPFITRERTRAGDLIAGTIVVHEPRPALLNEQAAGATGRSVTFTSRKLAIYGEHELETLADILHKAADGWADFAQLRTIATTIAAKIGYEGDEPTRAPHRFLKAFYQQQRAELERRLIYGQRIGSQYDRR
ncbi:MAG: RDD family protein [Phycisphaeraceae bacterium]